eukprot:scaffold1995_cov167-Amphora_coffeaeformis.AAC.20
MPRRNPHWHSMLQSPKGDRARLIHERRPTTEEEWKKQTFVSGQWSAISDLKSLGAGGAK